MADGKLQEYLKNKTNVGKSIQLKSLMAKIEALPQPKSPEDIQKEQLRGYQLESAKYSTLMAKEKYNDYMTVTPEEQAAAESDANYKSYLKDSAQYNSLMAKWRYEHRNDVPTTTPEPTVYDYNGVKFTTTGDEYTIVEDDKRLKDAKEKIFDIGTLGDIYNKNGKVKGTLKEYEYSLSERQDAKDYLLNRETFVAMNKALKSNMITNLGAAKILVDRGVEFLTIADEKGFDPYSEYDNTVANIDNKNTNFLGNEKKESRLSKYPNKDKFIMDKVSDFAASNFGGNTEKMDDFIDFYIEGYGDFKLQDARSILELSKIQIAPNPEFER